MSELETKKKPATLAYILDRWHQELEPVIIRRCEKHERFHFLLPFVPLKSFYRKDLRMMEKSCGTLWLCPAPKREKLIRGGCV
jgi:hypothetical protein